ncbi:MAG: LuxR C-terminal-related transcriptional regulator [Planctomycetaceae bacterium]
MSSTVLIVHPKELVVRGIESLLPGVGLKILPHAGNGADGLRLLRRHAPDLLVLSDTVPDHSPFVLARSISSRSGGPAILMIGGTEQPTYLARAVAAGVYDYVFESTPVDQIIASIRGALDKQPPSAHAPYGRMIALLAKHRPEATIPLSPREQQTLRHIAHGLSNEEIAQSMAISIETVKEHVQKILRKLKLNDRTQSAVWAVRQRMVD